MHLVTTLNPVRIELPMAAELGTEIIGPEYNCRLYHMYGSNYSSSTTTYHRGKNNFSS